MELAQNTAVTFAELPGTDLHQYILTDSEGNTTPLVGVTTMMKTLGLSSGYARVKPDILARAAARGTAIHELLQGYEMGKPSLNIIHYEWDCEDGTHRSEDEDCADMLKKYADISAKRFKAVAVEYLVSDNEKIASMIDFVSEVDEHTVDLIDYKSTSSLDKNALAWQLSIYRYLFVKQNPGIRVRDLVGLHCHNAKGTKAVVVAPFSDEEVEEAIRSFGGNTAGAIPSPSRGVVSVTEFLPEYPDLAGLLEAKRALKEQTDALDAVMADAVAALKEKMRSEHITQVTVPGGKYVFTDESVSTRFDTKRFKTAFPEMYEEYSVTSTSSASIRFVANKEK